MSRPVTISCIKCGIFLGELKKESQVRKGSVSLCHKCWERAALAIQMADLAASHTEEALKGSGSEVVDNLMNMFGMK